MFNTGRITRIIINPQTSGAIVSVDYEPAAKLVKGDDGIAVRSNSYSAPKTEAYACVTKADIKEVLESWLGEMFTDQDEYFKEEPEPIEKPKRKARRR